MKRDSKDGRLRENVCLHHVLGVSFFLPLFRALTALHRLCRVTRAIRKVMVKLRLYHSLGDREKQGEESEGQFHLWCRQPFKRHWLQSGDGGGGGGGGR